MGDDAVMATNDDATTCKRSAVQFGYIDDKYLPHMTKFTTRKAPEIHLGYFTRVRGLVNLLVKSIEAIQQSEMSPVQIVNLGAGFDTLYWRIKDMLPGHVVGNFIEVDFPTVTARKCHLIKKSRVLLEKIADEDGDVRLSKTDLHGSDYHAVGVDLSNTSALEKKLAECGVDYSRPTIFLAECVLVYIGAKETADFLRWCVDKFAATPLVFLNYEMVNMGDRFGQVMLENMSSRGCGMPGMPACKDKESQVRRFVDAGWSAAECWSMDEAYAQLPRQEVDDVEKLEMFDERELMKQLFEHYCFTVAWRNSERTKLEGIEFW